MNYTFELKRRITSLADVVHHVMHQQERKINVQSSHVLQNWKTGLRLFNHIGPIVLRVLK